MTVPATTHLRNELRRASVHPKWLCGRFEKLKEQQARFLLSHPCENFERARKVTRWMTVKLN